MNSLATHKAGYSDNYEQSEEIIKMVEVSGQSKTLQIIMTKKGY